MPRRRGNQEPVHSPIAATKGRRGGEKKKNHYKIQRKGAILQKLCAGRIRERVQQGLEGGLQGRGHAAKKPGTDRLPRRKKFVAGGSVGGLQAAFG